MLKLVIRKLIQGVLMMLVVSAIAFTLLSSAGGDALTTLRDNPQVSEETVERLREIYGLDRPVFVRYLSWISGAVRGNFGESFFYRTPVIGLVGSRLLNTLALGLVALFIALFVSSVLAFLSVRYPGRFFDELASIVVLLTASTPRIVLSLFALLVTVLAAGTSLTFSRGSAQLLVLAAFVLAFPLIAIFLAQMQSEMKLAMNETFVQLARAKGLSENKVILRHALRAALNPLLSIFGLSLGGILGGSVIVETVLGWPGLGALMVAAVRGRDVSLVMGIIVIASIAVWLGNSIAEMLQMVNDRRLRDAETN